MTDKHAINDAMAARALREYQRQLASNPRFLDFRDVLMAALNPPTEPEIPVSDGLAHNGWTALQKHGVKFATVGEALRAAKACYTAIERERLKQSVRVQRHRRLGDPMRHGCPEVYPHHREGDANAAEKALNGALALKESAAPPAYTSVPTATDTRHKRAEDLNFRGHHRGSDFPGGLTYHPRPKNSAHRRVGEMPLRQHSRQDDPK